MKKSTVYGFECLEFEFDGRYARLLCPKENTNGHWILKTEYMDAFPALEISMLERGYHVAFLENKTRWVNESDDHAKSDFADYLNKNFGLNKKCIPVGMSCGGMKAIYFAAKHPDKVALLCLDAPVVNLLSCPACVDRDCIHRTEFMTEFTKDTGMTANDLLFYRNHPFDVAPKILENNIPIVMISGDSDTVVPYIENGAYIEKLYREGGGIIEVHMKPGGDHHPHLLEDNTPIIEFIEKHLS